MVRALLHAISARVVRRQSGPLRRSFARGPRIGGHVVTQTGHLRFENANDVEGRADVELDAGMAITSVTLLSLRRSAGTRSARSTLDPLHLPISMTRSKDSRRPSATCGRKARQLCMVYADTSFKGHLVAKESAMRIIFTISDYCIGALRKARSCGGSIGATLLVHWVGFIPLSWSRSIPRRCMMICGPTS